MLTNIDNPLFKVYTMSATNNVSGGTGTEFAVDFSSCSGINSYTGIGVIAIHCSQTSILRISNIYISGHTAKVTAGLPSGYGTTISVTITFRILFVNSAYLKYK